MSRRFSSADDNYHVTVESTYYTLQMTMVSQWIVRLGLVLGGIVFALPLVGCTVVPVYRRAVLARPAMQDPIWPLIQASNQHMLEVRESSRGGTGATGGGCGCN